MKKILRLGLKKKNIIKNLYKITLDEKQLIISSKMDSFKGVHATDHYFPGSFEFSRFHVKKENHSGLEDPIFVADYRYREFGANRSVTLKNNLEIFEKLDVAAVFKKGDCHYFDIEDYEFIWTEIYIGKTKEVEDNLKEIFVLREVYFEKYKHEVILLEAEVENDVTLGVIFFVSNVDTTKPFHLKGEEKGEICSGIVLSEGGKYKKETWVRY